tara:strand:+ start:394 stop:1050 length:657 start_codon:yes stop_codon:yes gene_type:complete
MNNKKYRNQNKLNELKIIRENLLEYINQSKFFNLRSLSKSLGRNDAYLQQYIKRGSPRYLPEEERSHLCKILKIHIQTLTPKWLKIKNDEKKNVFKIRKNNKDFLNLPKEFFKDITMTSEDNLFFYEFNLNDKHEYNSNIKVIVDNGINQFEDDNEYILNDKNHLFIASLSNENKNHKNESKKINVRPLQKKYAAFRIDEKKINIFGKIIYRSLNIYN